MLRIRHAATETAQPMPAER